MILLYKTNYLFLIFRMSTLINTGKLTFIFFNIVHNN